MNVHIAAKADGVGNVLSPARPTLILIKEDRGKTIGRGCLSESRPVLHIHLPIIAIPIVIRKDSEPFQRCVDKTDRGRIVIVSLSSHGGIEITIGGQVKAPMNF